MNPAHWQRIKSLFEAAISQTPQERDAFLERECAEAPDLLAEVRRLLENESVASDLLEAAGRPVSPQLFAPNDIAAGRFRIVRLLGRGGMGEVYEAEDTLLRERLALKAIRPEVAADPAALTRFRQEIHLARKITHPNVCRIFDFQMQTGDPCRSSAFLTMELLPGETLAARLQRSGPLPPSEALPLARQMCAGLGAVHQYGIVHRDFKSSNVMLVPGREQSCRAVITDFGLARGANLDPDSTGLTGSGKLLGTLDYMAPEQLEKGESSCRTDIYSLGLVLFEMVTGALPFAERTPVEAALRRARDTAPSPRRLQPELSRAWETSIAACLQRDPMRRPGSVAEVLNLLEAEHAPASWRRRMLWVGVLAVLGLVIAAGVLLLGHAYFAGPVLWKPVPLTSFTGMEFQPAWSPDGELLAFAWDGEKQDNVDIYVMQTASGTVSRLTEDPAIDMSPAWSPDGRLIAFRRLLPETSQIILKSYLGGPERKLAEWPYENARTFHPLALSRDLCFSRDGKWLITSSGSFPAEFTGLFSVSLESGEAIKFTAPSGKLAADTEPALSPDGHLLAFVRVSTPSISEIYVMPFSDPHHPGHPTQITFDGRNVTNPAWTPDGRSIVFASNRKASEAARHLWRVSLPRLGATAKPPDPEFLAGLGDYTNGPAISKSGRLAYMAETHDLNVWELSLEAKDGKSASAKRVISSTRDDVLAEYSPDGKKITFGSNRSGHHEIWVCDRGGANPVRLTFFAGPLTTDPHWSPDGKQIVFSSRGARNLTQLYIISAQGGPPRPLACPSECSNPNWSHDGKWIYFCSAQDGTRQIWKMPAGGGKAIQITKKGGIFPEESPDGKYVYYSTATELNSSVWRVPVDGGEEVLVLPAVNNRNFAVTGQGIYFIPGGGWRSGSIPVSRENAGIRFYSFATGAVKLIYTTDRPVYRGLAVSCDGRSLLYSQFDRQDSDLWVVEHFR